MFDDVRQRAEAITEHTLLPGGANKSCVADAANVAKFCSVFRLYTH
jgi:hypothetical protein